MSLAVGFVAMIFLGDSRGYKLTSIFTNLNIYLVKFTTNYNLYESNTKLYIQLDLPISSASILEMSCPILHCSATPMS